MATKRLKMKGMKIVGSAYSKIADKDKKSQDERILDKKPSTKELFGSAMTENEKRIAANKPSETTTN